MMTYIPLRCKRKRTLNWNLSAITPLLHWHSNLLWLTLWACTHFQSQLAHRFDRSSVSDRIVVLQQALLNFWRGDMSDSTLGSLDARGRCSYRHLQLPGSSDQPAARDTNARHSTEEIRTFHQKKAAAEWPVIKALTESIQELAAVVQTDCMHSLHLISCSLFPTKSHNIEILIARKKKKPI